MAKKLVTPQYVEDVPAATLTTASDFMTVRYEGSGGSGLKPITFRLSTLESFRLTARGGIEVVTYRPYELPIEDGVALMRAAGVQQEIIDSIVAVTTIPKAGAAAKAVDPAVAAVVDGEDDEDQD